MSYILDALKKAEQERRHGQPPDIMTNPDRINPRPKKRLWPFAILILMVATAGSLGWFFGHEKTDTTKPLTPHDTQDYVVPVNPQTQAAQPTALPIEIPSINQPPITLMGSQPAKEEKSTSPDNAPVPLNDKRNISKGHVSARPADSKGILTKKEPRPIATSKSSQDIADDSNRPQPEKATVPDNKIYAINDLPEAVRLGLPSFTISTHIYSSDKAERLAAINGHIGREGQEVMTGITLESITADGAILRYQGYKFRVGLK